MKKLKIYGKRTLDQNTPCIILESKQARYARLSITSSKEIRLIIPQNLRNKERIIYQILKEKYSWIKKHLAKQKHPPFLPHLTPQLQQKAQTILAAKVTELSRRYQIPFQRLYIRNQKTRWGSCSIKGNISLNFRVAFLPPSLRDYVITHELIHIKYPNHSKKFWEEVKKYFPNYLYLKRSLKGYRLS